MFGNVPGAEWLFNEDAVVKFIDARPVVEFAAPPPTVSVADASSTLSTASSATQPLATPTIDASVATTRPPPAVSDAVPVIGWSVQIASAGSQDAAWSTWKNMQKKFKVLSDQTPVIVKADLGSKGVFFRVRIAGFDNQNGAKIACDHFRANGLSCYISKAEG